MHASPIWTGIGLAAGAAVSFRMMLVSRHLFSVPAY
jgi:hypothetical protein